MKTGILSILILTLFGLTNEKTDNSKGFECSIVATKSTYEIGETPEITVAIKNNSGKDIYLIGSLDASEEQWRSPYCYFRSFRWEISGFCILSFCQIERI